MSPPTSEIDWRRRLYFAWLEKLGEGDVAADVANHDALGIELCLYTAEHVNRESWEGRAFLRELDRNIGSLWDDAQADPPRPTIDITEE